jgi:hypothetical protein
VSRHHHAGHGGRRYDLQAVDRTAAIGALIVRFGRWVSVSIIATLAGIGLIGLILVDAFETVVLPRRVTRRFRLTRLIVLNSWRVWVRVARLLPSTGGHEGAGQREGFLGTFGPLSLLMLLGIWASGLVIGFGFLYWGTGTPLGGPDPHPGLGPTLYLSGETFFTIGYGDLAPREGIGRFLAVAEGATGFSFLAVIIAYLPVIFTAYSKPETLNTLIDARAGSPPTAAAFLARQKTGPEPFDCDTYLREWEVWTAELLEIHLSLPILTTWRSQHDRQSWLGALTLILDTTALVIVGLETSAGRVPGRQARLTFAMARHAVGDLCQILVAEPRAPVDDRLPAADLEQLREHLAAAGIALRPGQGAADQLIALRQLYEPYVAALAARLQVAVPTWLPVADAQDDWETTAWQWDPAEARDPVRGSRDNGTLTG